MTRRGSERGTVDLRSLPWAASEFSRLDQDQVDALIATANAANDILTWERGSVRVDADNSVIFVNGERAAVVLDWNGDSVLCASANAYAEIDRIAEGVKLDIQQWSIDAILAKTGVSVTPEDRDGDTPITLDIGHRLMLAGLINDIAKAGFDHGTYIRATVTIEPQLFVHGVITISKLDGVLFSPVV